MGLLQAISLCRYCCGMTAAPKDREGAGRFRRSVLAVRCKAGSISKAVEIVGNGGKAGMHKRSSEPAIHGQPDRNVGEAEMLSGNKRVRRIKLTFQDAHVPSPARERRGNLVRSLMRGRFPDEAEKCTAPGPIQIRTRCRVIRNLPPDGTPPA